MRLALGSGRTAIIRQLVTEALVVFGAVAISLLAGAATASLLPARRILRLDPAITLRQE